jgi:hypothetical protein
VARVAGVVQEATLPTTGAFDMSLPPSITRAARSVMKLTFMAPTSMARTAVALAIATVTAAACVTPRSGDGTTDSAAAPGASSGASPGAPAGQMAPSTGGSAKVTLETDRTIYPPGGTVNLRIINGDDVGYGFSACTRLVERRRSGEWFSVAEEGRVCTMMLQLLGPRQTVMATTELPSPLEAGEYRIVITFSREEGPAPGRDMPATTPAPSRVATAPFRVE